MNKLIYLIVIYLSTINLFVSGELDEEFQITDLGGTNLTFGTNYFIRVSSSNSYLRYDGNNNGELSGLLYVTNANLPNTTDESLIKPYIFVFERDVNYMVKLKNIQTNRYISYSSSYGFVLSNNSAYNSSLRVVIHASTNSINLASAYATSFVTGSYSIRSGLWFWSVHTSSSGTSFQFIEAPNTTDSTPPVIGDTNLIYGRNYYIRLSTNGNYLRYDGNNNGEDSGLTYVSANNRINSTSNPQINSFLFVIEPDVNNIIKIRNVRTNRYIVYASSNFILSNINSTNNNGLRHFRQPATSNFTNLVSASASLYMGPTASFRTGVIWHHSVPSTSSSTAFLEFIEGPNSTQITPFPELGDTNLTYGSNYFITYWTTNYYYGWDGNSFGDISGLSYIYQNDLTNIAENDMYKFAIEPEINNMVKLRNIRTNRYISYSPTINAFILSNNNSYNNSVRVVLNPETNYVNLANPSLTSSQYLYNGNTFSSTYLLYYVSRTATTHSFKLISSSETTTTPSISTITTPVSIPTNPNPITSSTTTITTITTPVSIPANSTTISPITTTSSPIISTPTPSPPLNYIFRAVIRSYEYEIPDPDLVDERTDTLVLIPRTVINNTSPGSITEKILYNENIEESFSWFYRSLSKLNITVIDRSISLPPIVRRNIAFKNGKQNIISNIYSNNKREIVYNREFNIDRTIDVKPRTSIDYILYAHYITNLKFNFVALAKITGNDSTSNQLNGEALSEILETLGNYTVVEINDDSVVIEVNGLLIADLVSGFYFEVNSDDTNINTDCVECAVNDEDWAEKSTDSIKLNKKKIVVGNKG